VADILENTPEFQRGFDAQTSKRQVPDVAGREPYTTEPFIRDDAPRFFEEHEMEHVLDDYLANEEYHPFQIIVEDDREGFDENGDFHAVPNLEKPENVRNALIRSITPHRWAEYLQDAVVQYCSTIDYTVGRSERCDIVQDIVSERMEACSTMQERYALEDALQIWFRVYGGGHDV
jgi:hypothetical protein